MILLTILVFIFILGLLVFVHELGHFIMAKRAGMKVEEFGFGFPPRIFGIKKGETTYSINWIPLGGFVRILGEDGGSEDPRSFGQGKFWPRLSVLLAGVVMNFILGWFLIFLGFLVIGSPIEVGEGADVGRAQISNPQLSVIAVQAGAPADVAGFRPGDVILSVDGQKFESVDELISYTKSRAGQNVTYELKRGRDIFDRSATPRVNPPEGQGPVGFAPALIAKATYPLADALKYSFASFYGRVAGIFMAFGMLFKGLFTSGKLIEGLSGPVGIAVLTRDFTRLGIVYLTQFAAVLSINLGIINAFPFPALDGGRVLFLIIEKIRGAKSLKWERIANAVGFLLLMLLMVAITFRDVNRFSEQFKRLFERMF
ncbi:MAG: RIP metalloprotease RseP [bacterium]|nr:RIP metalloprotease RseP [bacterium]